MKTNWSGSSLISRENDEIPKLRQRLAMVIQDYSNKTKTTEERNIGSIYLRYGVDSRTQLTREQLEECIRFYQDWILYDN